MDNNYRFYYQRGVTKVTVVPFIVYCLRVCLLFKLLSGYPAFSYILPASLIFFFLLLLLVLEVVLEHVSFVSYHVAHLTENFCCLMNFFPECPLNLCNADVVY